MLNTDELGLWCDFCDTHFGVTEIEIDTICPVCEIGTIVDCPVDDD